MQINFTQKEEQVIELIVPGQPAEVTVNKVLRDWFDSNVERMPKAIKTKDEILDEIIQVASVEVGNIVIK